jgi:hypothetical protein
VAGARLPWHKLERHGQALPDDALPDDALPDDALLD